MPLVAISTTWIDVTDDAVKIGLGGIIGGAFTWLVARYNAKSTIQRLQFERRSNILSQAAEVYEAFFQAWLKYSNRLHGIAKASQTPPDNQRDALIYHGLLVDQGTEATDLRMHMKQKMEESFTAQSQLMLLGEERCKAGAEALHRAIMAADAGYKFDGDSFDLTNVTATHDGVRNAREAFYKEMQKAFHRN